MQRPSLDVGELAAAALTFKGVFDADEARVDGADCAGVIGEGRLSHVLVSMVNLTQSELGPLELFDARFENVELSNGSWPQVRGQRTEFLHCRGLGWRVGLEQATDVYLAGCQLDYAVIRVDKVKGLLTLRGATVDEQQAASAATGIASEAGLVVVA